MCVLIEITDFTEHIVQPKYYHWWSLFLIKPYIFCGMLLFKDRKPEMLVNIANLHVYTLMYMYAYT